MNDPFKYTNGPRDAEVILVGEAWGSEEALASAPFVGQSGRELDRILFEAGLPRNRVLCTNVVDARPAQNEFEAFLIPGREKVDLFRGVRATPRLREGHAKLLALIDAVKPKLVIGAGGVPLWALTSHGNKTFGGIMNWRGSQTYTDPIGGRRVPYLPVVHPAAVLRAWDLRPLLVHDVKSRATRFLSGKLAWEPPKTNSVWRGEFGWVKSKLESWLRRANSGAHFHLAADIETYRRRDVVCIGFADEDSEICIPFFYFKMVGEDNVSCDVYTLEQEQVLCQLIREALLHTNIEIIGQNWIYDYQFIRKWLGIKSPPKHDTMIMQHLCWPGTPKSLDYIASLYSNYYCFWKNESNDWATSMGHEDLWKYNCKDVRYTYDCAQVLLSLVQKMNLSEQYSFQMEQWLLAAAMMDRGVCIDLQRRKQVSEELKEAARDIESFLIDVVPEDTRYTDAGKPWFTSPTLTKDIFYRQLCLPPILQKKTKTLTTGAEALDELKKKVPWLKPVFERLEQLRSIQVFRSHFLEAGLSLDWRLRCTFYVGGTETFRWSSGANAFDEGTNLQNIPKGDKE